MEHFWLSMFDSLLFIIHIKYETFFSIETQKEFKIYFISILLTNQEIILFCLVSIGSSQSGPIAWPPKPVDKNWLAF